MRFLFVLVLAGCNHIQVQPDPPGPDHMDPVEQSNVERVCTVLRDLKCEAGETTPEGNTCEDVINNAADRNINLVGDVDCIERATTCADAEACDG